MNTQTIFYVIAESDLEQNAAALHVIANSERVAKLEQHRQDIMAGYRRQQVEISEFEAENEKLNGIIESHVWEIAELKARIAWLNFVKSVLFTLICAVSLWLIYYHFVR